MTSTIHSKLKKFSVFSNNESNKNCVVRVVYYSVKQNYVVLIMCYSANLIICTHNKMIQFRINGARHYLMLFGEEES